MDFWCWDPRGAGESGTAAQRHPANGSVGAEWRWELQTTCQKSDKGTCFPVKDASDLSASISSPSHRLLN